MIPEIRKAILEVKEEPHPGHRDEFILRELKLIFGFLRNSERQYYNPKKFVRTFKDIDGS